MGPDFICIGAQRSGTTWLHNSLNKHPQLWLTPVKELHHFDDPKRTRYFKHLKNRLKTTRMSLTKWDRNYFFSIKNDDEWYCGLFKDAQKKGLIAGEITPAYAVLDEADFIRIKAINPEVKIIFIMRNPIERSWSAFMNAKRKNRAGKDHDDQTQSAVNFALKQSALTRSLYIDTINRLEKVFDSHKICYVFYDDIVNNPAALMKDLLNFLDVDTDLSETIITKERVNGVANGMDIPANFIDALIPHIMPSLEKLKEKFPHYPSIWVDQITKLSASKSCL